MNNKEALEKLEFSLESLDLRSKLEVIANYFIKLGIQHFKNYDWSQSLSSRNLLQALMDEKEANGETIATALVQQGLVLMMWLEKEVKEK